MEGSTAFFTTILVSAGLQLTATGVITHFDLESFPCSVQQGNDSKSKRSEEHTSELQSRPHISYAVFCLKKKKNYNIPNHI